MGTGTTVTARPGPRWGIASFPSVGTTARVLVTAAQRLGDAVEVVSSQLEQLDDVASRFRADSEVARLASGRPTAVSPLLLGLVQAALRAARISGGAVDPTVGGALSGLGYDRDFTAVAARPAGPLVVRQVPGWWAVEVDPDARTVRVPAGVVLDLGATAKAYAADRAARDAAAAAGCGVLVSLGGDVAVAGACPPGGWTVRLSDDANDTDPDLPSVRIRSGGLATSSTAVRHWLRGGIALHHILDPVTGLPADTPWRTVSVAAASCLDAQIAATATMVRGLDWLGPTGLPARLVGTDGAVRAVGGWPA